jgi:hypothetical protein
MGSFRGSDESLEAEIAALEAMAKVRVRRYARDLKDLDKDLSELKAERGRRKARSAVPSMFAATEESSSVG